MEKRLYFFGGTLVLEGVPFEETDLPAVFLWSHGKWRTEAYQYASLLPWLHQQKVRDTVPRWQHLNYTLHEKRQPHDYQVKALAAWHRAGRRGSVVLPTGAGKSYVAVQAIHQVNRSAVVVAPTIDLLHQWYRLLSHAFQTEIGVYYGAEKSVHPVTVCTYSSFGNLMSEHGCDAHLIVLDEAHRAGSPAFSEGALMSIAPARLGLTATYPSDEEQRGFGRWRIDDLIGGPIVYALNADELAGEQLAAYRTQRIRVDLTEPERQRYEQDFACCMQYVREHQLVRQHGAGWLRALQKASASDREARAALLARQRISRLLAGCQGKLQIVDELLREHSEEQIVIFTDANRVAYHLAQLYLVPVISHLSSAVERKEILDGYQQGRYRVVITSRVLDEGVDLPSAKIAIILGGTSGARQYIQRRGRVLRKVENKEAVVYEVLVRGTTEEGKAQRRQAAVRQQGKDIDRVNR